MAIKKHIHKAVLSNWILLVAGILVGAGLFAIGWFIYQQYFSGAPSQNTNDATEDDQTDSSDIPESALGEYTSFDREFTLSYNKELYRIEASSTALYLWPINHTPEAKTVSLLYSDAIPDDETDPLSWFVTDKTTLTEGTAESLGSNTINGIEVETYRITRPSPFGNELLDSVNFFFVEEGVGYQLKVEPYDESAEASGRDFLEHFSFVDLSEVDPIARYSSSTGGYEFTYNRSQWYLTENTGTYVTLNWNQNEITGLPDMITVWWGGLDLYNTAPGSSALGTIKSSELSTLQGNTQWQNGSYSVEQTTVEDEPAYIIDGQRSLKSDPEATIQHVREYIVVQDDNVYIIRGLFYDATDPLEHFNALVETFAFVELSASPPSASPAASSTTTCTPQDAEMTDVERVTALNMPAIVRVINEYCGYLEIPYDATMPNSSGVTLSICNLGWGSGFFVNNDGYLVTNGHVAVNTPNWTIYEMMTSGLWDDYAVSLIVDVSQYDTTNGPMTADEVYGYLIADPYSVESYAASILMYALQDQAATFTLDASYYVQMTETAANIDTSTMQVTNTDDVLKADLIDYEYDELDPDTLTSGYEGDVALLKLDEEADYPIVELGDTSGVAEGMDVIVIGYPGAVDSTLYSFDQGNGDIFPLTGSPTITRGVVSSIRNDLSLVQIDASVSGGNSGGPGLSNEGKVIGMVTYASLGTGAADYNFLRLIEEVKDIMDVNDIENTGGNTDQYWRSGMEALRTGNYRQASEDLQRAKTAYPDHRGIARYLDLVRCLATNFESTTESDNAASGISSWIYIAGGAGAVVIGGAVIAIAIVARKKEKAQIAQTGAATSAPVTTSAPEPAPTPPSAVAASTAIPVPTPVPKPKKAKKK